ISADSRFQVCSGRVRKRSSSGFSWPLNPMLISLTTSCLRTACNDGGADILRKKKFPGSDALKSAKWFAYLKLMEKNQNTDPFKFIIYSAEAGEQTPQINADDVKNTRGAKR